MKKRKNEQGENRTIVENEDIIIDDDSERKTFPSPLKPHSLKDSKRIKKIYKLLRNEVSDMKEDIQLIKREVMLLRTLKEGTPGNVVTQNEEHAEDSNRSPGVHFLNKDVCVRLGNSVECANSSDTVQARYDRSIMDIGDISMISTNGQQNASTDKGYVEKYSSRELEVGVGNRGKCPPGELEHIDESSTPSNLVEVCRSPGICENPKCGKSLPEGVVRFCPGVYCMDYTKTPRP